MRPTTNGASESSPTTTGEIAAQVEQRHQARIGLALAVLAALLALGGVVWAGADRLGGKADRGDVRELDERMRQLEVTAARTATALEALQAGVAEVRADVKALRAAPHP